MKLNVKNLQSHLVTLTDTNGEIVALPPRSEVTIDASQKSQDFLIKEERKVIRITPA